MGENPLNRSIDHEDIVSTSREILEKFIRELHRLTIYVKITFMSTDEGKEAYATKESATKFNEGWYDKTYDHLMTLINANTKTDFV